MLLPSLGPSFLCPQDHHPWLGFLCRVCSLHMHPPASSYTHVYVHVPHPRPASPSSGTEWDAGATRTAYCLWASEAVAALSGPGLPNIPLAGSQNLPLGNRTPDPGLLGRECLPPANVRPPHCSGASSDGTEQPRYPLTPAKVLSAQKVTAPQPS